MEAIKRNRYLVGASAVFLLGIGNELFRLFIHAWPNVARHHSYFMSSVMIAVWLTSMLVFWGWKQDGRLKNLAWVTSFVAPLSMALHGFMTRYVAKSLEGLPYFVGALVLAFCIKRMWAEQRANRRSVPRRIARV